MIKIVSITDIISHEKFKNSKFDNQMKNAIIRINWKNIVGEFLAKNSYPGYIKDDCLVIYVSSSTWLHHMSFLSSDILKELVSILKIDDIKNLKFLVNQIYHSKEKPEIDNEWRSIINNVALPNELINRLEQISSDLNSEIKTKFLNMLKSVKKREAALIQNGFVICNSCGNAYEKEKKCKCK